MQDSSPTGQAARPLFRKLDCYSLPVADLEVALAFYGALGHTLLWRQGDQAAGLRLPDSDAELVLRTDQRPLETCLLVEAVPQAIERIVAAGGRLAFGPIEIAVGRYALLRDPWGNPLPVLDFSKGLLRTDEQGNVVGNMDTG